MSSVEQRIVQMQFDNRSFEGGVKTTLGSLKSLSEGLKLKGATNGLSDVDKGIKNLSNSGVSGLASGVEAVTAKFSALGVMGVTALVNITNSAVNAGKKLVKSLTIDPIKDGFQEYELKMNSIQTILTNTASKGTTLKEVNTALNELNKYSDETIYNFAQMTDNIGKATAAGVGLGDSVKFVKGMANVAAGFGVDATKMAGATYQMTQALAAGSIKLMDWKSMETAGMGGDMLQKELKKTAKELGVTIGKGESFRETLKSGWLSSKVFIKTMERLAEDEGLKAAATNVTSFTKLLDTMKETVGSGWGQSFEHIFGDKDQSTKLWTSISDAFGNIVNKSADARNALLKFWNESGGRDDVIKGLANIVNSVGKGLNAVQSAFKEVFPSITKEQLTTISKGFKDLTERFKMTDKTAGMIKATFKGLFSIFDLFKNIISAVVKTIAPAGGLFISLANAALTVSSAIGKLFTKINDTAKETGIVDKVYGTIERSLNKLGKAIDNVSINISSLFKALSKLNYKPLMEFINKVGSGLGSGLESALSGLGKSIGNINFNTVIGAMTAIAAGKGLNGLTGIVKTIKGTFDSIKGITSNASDILDGVRDSLEAYQTNLKAGTLMKIAVAVGILALSLAILSGIDAPSMETALTGITILFLGLIGSMYALVKLTSVSKLKGFWTLASGMIALSVAILVLSVAMRNIAQLSWEKIGKGLASIAGLILLLAGASKLMDGGSKGLIRTSIGLVIFSVAIKSLGDSLKTLGTMKPETLIQGLYGLGLVLAELALFLSVTNFSKMGIKSSVGILIVAGALVVLSKAVEQLGSMNAVALGQGMFAIGILLTELSMFVNLTGSGKKIITTAIGLTILGVALNVMALALNKIGSLPLKTLEKGLVAVSGALLVMGLASALIPGGALIKTAIGVGIMAGSLLLLTESLKSMGSMSWEEIGKSMIVLASSIVILAAAMVIMSTGLPGAAAMFVMSAALAVFVPQLKALAELSLEQIGLGLLALAGSFAAIGLAALILTPIIPAIFSLAGAIALLGLGALAAGTGIGILAAGLALLGTTGVAGVWALLDLCNGIIKMIPQMAIKLAQGLVAFIVELGKSVPQIIEAAGQMIDGILTAFNNALPKIADSALKLIVIICNVLKKAVPQLIDVGIDMLMAILNGLERNINKIVQVVIDIIVKIVDTLSANIGKLVQAGITLAINFMNGLAEGIRKNQPAITKAATNLITAVIQAIAGTVGDFTTMGKNLIGGLIKGVSNKAKEAVEAAKGVVKSAIEGAKKLLGIKSPSRVFMGIGEFTMLGFAKGLKDNMSVVTDGVKSIARGTIDSMSDNLQSIANIISGEIDATPVITPVMDLSNITNGGKMIDKIFGNNSMLTVGAQSSLGLSKSIGNIQNGTDNSDIIGALRDLRKEISNSNNVTNIVNGVTYDDGSNINSAVQSLVNAAKIERRI